MNNIDNNNLFMAACSANDTTLVRDFLSKNNFNPSFNNNESLKKACENCNSYIVKLLLKKIKIVNLNEFLNISISNSDSESVLYFFEAGVDFSFNNYIALKIAVKKRNLFITKTILDVHEIDCNICIELFKLANHNIGYYLMTLHSFSYNDSLFSYFANITHGENINPEKLTQIIEKYNIDCSSKYNTLIKNAHVNNLQKVVDVLWNQKNVKDSLRIENNELYNILITPEINKKVSSF
jgi:hypothetical protein